MNREIKFRAWDENRMRPVNTLGFTDDAFVSTSKGSGPIEDYKIMQYTGLKDKNGVEIYENDVVRVSLSELEKRFGENLRGKISGSTGVVEFIQAGMQWWVSLEEDERFSIDHKSEWYSGYSFLILSGEEWRSEEQEITPDFLEVIGNIYENPELIKPQNE